MKFIIVLSVFFAAVHGLDKDFIERFMGRVQKAGGECKQSSAVTDADIQDLLAKKVPTTKEGKCMVMCMHKEFGVQNAEGKLDKAAAMVETEKVKTSGDVETYNKLVTVLDHCMGTVKDAADPCDTAAAYMECALAKCKEVGIDESVLGL